MKRVHIVGRKNNGKTKLVMDLVGEMNRRGLRVGTIKHSPRNHELDVPGKDSFRQREAGANPAAIITRQLIGLFAPRDPDGDVYKRLGGMFAGCDLVLVEGDIEADGMKIEVWRETAGTPCLALEHADIAAIVTDDPIDVDRPVWPRADIAHLADRVIELANDTTGP